MLILIYASDLAPTPEIEASHVENEWLPWILQADRKSHQDSFLYNFPLWVHPPVKWSQILMSESESDFSSLCLFMQIQLLQLVFFFVLFRECYPANSHFHVSSYLWWLGAALFISNFLTFTQQCYWSYHDSRDWNTYSCSHDIHW